MTYLEYSIRIKTKNGLHKHSPYDTVIVPINVRSEMVTMEQIVNTVSCIYDDETLQQLKEVVEEQISKNDWMPF